MKNLMIKQKRKKERYYKMPKKNKLKTPEWILKGYDSLGKYEKEKKSPGKSEKKFKIKKCPSCNSYNSGVVVGEEAVGLWKCRACKWKGQNISTEEVETRGRSTSDSF